MLIKVVVWECGRYHLHTCITCTCICNICCISGDDCDEGSYRLIPNPSLYLYDYDYDSYDSPPYGRVELCSNGDWISVCSNGFEQEEARAICTDIGYYRTGKNNFKNFIKVL